MPLRGFFNGLQGEGLVGIARAFLASGARRVVASHWRGEDAASAALMHRFYENMLGPESLPHAAALRKAQLGLRAERRFRSPYFWASFALQGDWR